VSVLERGTIETVDTIDWDSLAPPCDREAERLLDPPHCPGDPASWVVGWKGCDCYPHFRGLFCNHCSLIEGNARCGHYGAYFRLSPL
jgi:hypothetical protein